MTAVDLTSDDGLKLVGELEGPEDPRAVLLFCHAHPKMGGTMKSPLILAIRDELIARDWAILRFNFRGIEGSEGEPSDGVEEVRDALGALRYLKDAHPSVPVAVAGWSFGAAVAARLAARHPELAGLVMIAPSIEPKPEVSAGLPPPEDLGLEVPLLVAVGDNDDVTAPDVCRAWAEGAGGEYVEIKAANHFFWAKYEALAPVVADWLDGHIN